MKRIIALILVIVTALTCLVSCGEALGTGYSEYAKTRDIEGRDIHYVEISVKHYGKMIVLLDGTTAPKTVENFLKLAEDGFYDGLTFHRVIKDFMIQGGDPDGNGSGGSKDKIKGEFEENGHYNNIRHKRGVISMARSNDYDSASSQFFICNADAEVSLDGKYAAFGYVIMGMSVVDAITEDVFPKTAYYDFYGTSYHQYWAAYGNGAIENDKDKPVINYIKVLKDYTPDFDYGE